MNPETVNSIVKIIVSLVPFALVGGWLFYRETAKRSQAKRAENAKKIIRVGDKKFTVRKASRLLVVEKNTGREAIVTTCGSEDEPRQENSELTSLPKWVKVCYRLQNGIFSPEESDWLDSEKFSLLGVRQVEEYAQV
ncbi:MAG: hypothetical protein C0616_14915 [Desulfuromonas sp.]|nr:MAG: hypothetical protein C0616_14915 [Desulfuromonas sp.]